jgi:predicted nucleic acid-binding protein
LSSGPLGRLVTTHAVLTEVADALGAPSHRRWAVQAIDDLLGDPNVACLAVDSEVFAGGLKLYRTRHDKGWSLTDCISFAVMKRRGLTQALTPDVHFVQAGFRALMRE